jgi:hypothetical protein
MWQKVKNFISNEIAYLIGAPTLIMLGVVIYGIFFDYWYKDVYNIILASFLLYILSIVIRFLGWMSGKIKR